MTNSKKISPIEKERLNAIYIEFEHVSKVAQNSDLFQFKILAYYIVAIIALSAIVITKVADINHLLSHNYSIAFFVFINQIFIVTYFYPGITTYRANMYIHTILIPKIIDILGLIDNKAPMEWWFSNYSKSHPRFKQISKLLKMDVIYSLALISIPYIISFFGLLHLYVNANWDSKYIFIIVFLTILFGFNISFLIIWSTIDKSRDKVTNKLIKNLRK